MLQGSRDKILQHPSNIWCKTHGPLIGLISETWKNMCKYCLGLRFDKVLSMDIHPFCRQHVVSDSHGLIKASRKLREFAQLQPFQRKVEFHSLGFQRPRRLQYQSPLAMTRLLLILESRWKKTKPFILCTSTGLITRSRCSFFCDGLCLGGFPVDLWRLSKKTTRGDMVYLKRMTGSNIKN